MPRQQFTSAHSRSLKKWRSRECNISTYRQVLEQESIPAGSLYWTLCGALADENGQLLERCELNQVIEAELVRSHQVCLVERDQATHQAAQHTLEAAFPDEASRPRLYRGDFVEVLLRHQRECPEVPASVIHLDLMHEPKRAAGTLALTLRALSWVPFFPTLVMWNVVREHFQVYSEAEVFDAIDTPGFRSEALRKQWKIVAKGGERWVNVYDGANEAKTTVMQTSYFIRTAR